MFCLCAISCVLFVVATLLTEHFFLANLSACAWSFASLVFCIVGLFTSREKRGRKQTNDAKYRTTALMLKYFPERNALLAAYLLQNVLSEQLDIGPIPFKFPSLVLQIWSFISTFKARINHDYNSMNWRGRRCLSTDNLVMYKQWFSKVQRFETTNFIKLSD